MGALDGRWERFAAEILDGASPEQREAARVAFYAGALGFAVELARDFSIARCNALVADVTAFHGALKE